MNETVAKPRVFISYCWYKEETREWVLRLAEDLQGLGVHVTIDTWDLKEGQDVYAFMESCVTNEEINRVLIVCDKAYAEKADSRSGGVGAETAIISKKVYEKVGQTKFVPVLLERDEAGQAILPTYLSSRKYVDFSYPDNYPNSLEQLVRVLFGRPITKRPPLGMPPSYVLDESTQAFASVSLFQTLHRNLSAGRQVKDDLFSFSKALLMDVTQLMMATGQNMSIDQTIERIKASQQIRDNLYEVINLSLRYDKEPLVGNFLHDFFEQGLALFYYRENYEEMKGAYSIDVVEQLMYEFFIGSVSLLLRNKSMLALSSLLDGKFFIFRNGEYRALSFCAFRTYSRNLEDGYNAQYEKEHQARLHTVRGYLLSEMATSPLVKMSDYVESDVFLSVRSLLAEGEDTDAWFPVLAVYGDHGRALKMFKRAVYVPYFNELLAALGVSDRESFLTRFWAGHKKHGVGNWRFTFQSLDVARLIEVEKLGTAR